MIYPKATFASINELTRNPYDIENCLQPWSRPGRYTLWSEDTFVTAGMPRVLTFHTDAHQVHLTLPDGSRLMRTAPHGVAIGFSSPVTNWGLADDPVQLYVNSTQLTASTVDDGQHQGYIERYGASLKLRGAPDGPWDSTTLFRFSVKNLKLQALPGFTLAVDLRLAKTQVPNFFGQLTDGFSSAFGEKPSWNSQDLQNTPLSGNFHGRWPLFPNSPDDTGARPASIPAATAFDATIEVSDASATGFTLRFSQPLDPDEFGIGLDAVSSWTTQWAADNASVRITYVSPRPRGDVNIIIFRAVDAAGNMIGGPAHMTDQWRS